MSAFIVKDETINGLLSFLNQNDRCGYGFRQLGYQLTNRESLQELASALYLLNCDAVDERYGKGTAAEDEADAPTFEFKQVYNVTAVQAYKAARCLRYQCSEGNVPDRPLYKALDNEIQMLADFIISAMPEYEAAQWGLKK